MGTMDWDKLMKFIAIAQFLADYHSGQWSRGYRLLSIALRRLNAFGVSHPLEYELNPYQSMLYRQLVRTYSNKV